MIFDIWTLFFSLREKLTLHVIYFILHVITLIHNFTFFLYFVLYECFTDIDVSSMTGMELVINIMTIERKNSAILELLDDLENHSKRFLRCKYTSSNQLFNCSTINYLIVIQFIAILSVNNVSWLIVYRHCCFLRLFISSCFLLFISHITLLLPFLSLIPNLSLIISHLISSYLILSHLISSYLILSYLISSYLILSHLILPYLILSHLTLSRLISSYLISSYLISSYLILPYLISPYLILPTFILSPLYFSDSFTFLSYFNFISILVLSIFVFTTVLSILFTIYSALQLERQIIPELQTNRNNRRT